MRTILETVDPDHYLRELKDRGKYWNSMGGAALVAVFLGGIAGFIIEDLIGHRIGLDICLVLATMYFAFNSGVAEGVTLEKELQEEFKERVAKSEKQRQADAG